MLSGLSLMITIRNLYDHNEALYTKRFLIERSWPKDRKRTGLHFEGWLKEIAPSAGLSAWFDRNHDKWPEFCRRYFAELDARPEAWKLLLEEASRCTVELLHISNDEMHNNARALKEYLDSKLGQATPHSASDSMASANLMEGDLK
jgi:uncharacterized protein YeaO (DUF488 family)